MQHEQAKKSTAFTRHLSESEQSSRCLCLIQSCVVTESCTIKLHKVCIVCRSRQKVLNSKVINEPAFCCSDSLNEGKHRAVSKKGLRKYQQLQVQHDRLQQQCQQVLQQYSHTQQQCSQLQTQAAAQAQDLATHKTRSVVLLCTHHHQYQTETHKSCTLLFGSRL